MVVDPRDIKIPAYIATILGLCALILACIGIGTPAWQIVYSDAPNNTSPFTSTNFYYTCYAGNASCTNYPYSTDDYIHLRLASGLGIVGILFLTFGIIGTYILGLYPFIGPAKFQDSRYYDLYVLSGPFCLFIATITMLAALAEGSQTVLYNGYSANLYQTAHVISIFVLLGSAYASGRRSLISSSGMEPLLNNK
ncbi:unnamed protein product [Rotaria sp. Silwood2]|nr:unnamed protein product [Rotaria sp. Silwood2]CAF2925623.1 unnamed protein product [Rotaria sp. Silwood2]CAF3202746.1 unnamed protein product [Rotaria sp. Silwood2]CAF3340928.1 unnamed protein product [Rotaria sp. Silwood2]CAF3913924.1 unnamed protein product [Rotaria sp. Silwood2]